MNNRSAVIMTSRTSPAVPLFAVPTTAPAAGSGLGNRLQLALARLHALFARPAAPALEEGEVPPVSRETWALGYAGFDRAAYRMHLRTPYDRTRI